MAMAKEVRKFCTHCEESLAPRTYREHARLYYDTNSHSWTKKRRVDCNLDLGGGGHVSGLQVSFPACSALYRVNILTNRKL